MEDPLSVELLLPAVDCALAEPQSIAQETKTAEATMRTSKFGRKTARANE